MKRKDADGARAEHFFFLLLLLLIARSPATSTPLSTELILLLARVPFYATHQHYYSFVAAVSAVYMQQHTITLL